MLASWGLTHLLISGKIIERFRNKLIVRSNFFAELLSCYQCTGFWSGLLVSIYFTTEPLHMVLMSLISSGICPIINSLYVYLNTKIRKMQQTEENIS
jgi:hypothetical protein